MNYLHKAMVPCTFIITYHHLLYQLLLLHIISLRAFALYVPFLCTLSARLACLFQALYAPYLCAFKSFLGWIHSQVETFIFTNTIKGTTNRAVFMQIKKQLWCFLRGGICWAYSWSNNFLGLKQKNSPNKKIQI